jgi:hypothetical protein
VAIYTAGRTWTEGVLRMKCLGEYLNYGEVTGGWIKLHNDELYNVRFDVLMAVTSVFRDVLPCGLVVSDQHLVGSCFTLLQDT